MDLPRICRISVQKGIRAAGQPHIQAKLAVHDPAKHAEARIRLLLPAPFAPTRTFTSFNASLADRIDVNPSTTTDLSR